MDKVIREALRYLGYRRGRASGQEVGEVQACLEQLRRAVTPRHVYSLWDVSLGDGTVTLGGVQIASRSLSGHLRGAERAIAFAATLGLGADRLIKRLSGESMASAVVANACASALIEHYCDEATAAIETGGLFPLPRFSPGYGDFSIQHQADLARLTDCARKIGVTVTDSMLLSPAKSVTAIIGLTREERCAPQQCAACGKTDCPFRRETT